jgi:hypothetical protein
MVYGMDPLVALVVRSVGEKANGATSTKSRALRNVRVDNNHMQRRAQPVRV